jgi:hypothetical protein
MTESREHAVSPLAITQPLITSLPDRAKIALYQMFIRFWYYADYK